VAPGERGLKRGLAERRRTVILMLDETIICETPPLYSCYGRIGEQVCVPITGNRAKRILHGTINARSGEVVLLITEEWVQETHQYFLSMIRSHWRGWNIVLFEDRGSPHTAEASLELAFIQFDQSCLTDNPASGYCGLQPSFFKKRLR
jgi:hypothetical protein